MGVPATTFPLRALRALVRNSLPEPLKTPRPAPSHGDTEFTKVSDDPEFPRYENACDPITDSLDPAVMLIPAALRLRARGAS